MRLCRKYEGVDQLDLSKRFAPCVIEVEINTCDMVKVERMSGLMQCASLIDMISSSLRKLLLIVSLRDVIHIEYCSFSSSSHRFDVRVSAPVGLDGFRKGHFSWVYKPRSSFLNINFLMSSAMNSFQLCPPLFVINIALLKQIPEIPAKYLFRDESL